MRARGCEYCLSIGVATVYGIKMGSEFGVMISPIVQCAFKSSVLREPSLIRGQVVLIICISIYKLLMRRLQVESNQETEILTGADSGGEASSSAFDVAILLSVSLSNSASSVRLFGPK